MNLIDAVAEQIRRNGKPIVTWFDVEAIVRELFRERRFDGKTVKIRRDYPTLETFEAIRSVLINPNSLDLRALSELVEFQSALLEQAAQTGGRLLLEDAEFSRQVWRVAGIQDGSPEELCCLLDPWCYISHFSAMQRWSFSDRNPTVLHLTRPAKASWKQQADAELHEMRRSTSNNCTSEPRVHVTFPTVLRRKKLQIFQPSYSGRSVTVPGTHARISTVGQTFWDMIQEPKRCGGMAHVIEVCRERAKDFAEDIISVFEDKAMPTTNLAFCRAGYIFEEVVGYHDLRVASWTRFGKQGGSSKLDPEAPFETRHSERWNISLNI